MTNKRNDTRGGWHVRHIPVAMGGLWVAPVSPSHHTLVARLFGVQQVFDIIFIRKNHDANRKKCNLFFAHIALYKRAAGPNANYIITGKYALFTHIAHTSVVGRVQLRGSRTLDVCRAEWPDDVWAVDMCVEQRPAHHYYTFDFYFSPTVDRCLFKQYSGMNEQLVFFRFALVMHFLSGVSICFFFILFLLMCVIW